MADQDPSEIRVRARLAVDHGRLPSVIEAAKFFCAFAGVCALLAGGLAALQKFDATWLVALLILTAVGTVVTYVILEQTRLNGHTALLREMLASEKYYESLLTDARGERDQARVVVQSLQARIDLIGFARQLASAPDPKAIGQAEPLEPKK